MSKRQQHTLDPKPRPSTPPPQNPAILILTTMILAAKILPAEIKAAPNVHPAVVPRLSATGLNLPYHSQSARSTDATAACHQMQTRIVVVNPVHPAVGKTPGQESVMPVVPTRHHQNGRGTDVHTAPHLNQICRHHGTDVMDIGTAPYHLRQHPHIRLPQVAHLHPATDTAIKGEGTAADRDDDTVLVQPASHPSLVKRIMCLLRMLFLTAAQHNFTVTLSHLPGQHNTIADALSRCQFTRFFALAPQADPTPTATPGILSTL